ncbi:hypothetical protein, partial [Amycolatopsis cihanbeyliensis]
NFFLLVVSVIVTGLHVVCVDAFDGEVVDRAYRCVVADGHNPHLLAVAGEELSPPSIQENSISTCFQKI